MSGGAGKRNVEPRLQVDTILSIYLSNYLSRYRLAIGLNCTLVLWLSLHVNNIMFQITKKRPVRSVLHTVFAAALALLQPRVQPRVCERQ